jgi:hypothetical protein
MPQLARPPSVYRAFEFYALLASAHLDWDVRDNDIPALEADQVRVAGRHHLESVSFMQVRSRSRWGSVRG